MSRAAERLLLVEFFATALRRNEKSMLFPFLKGLAGGCGVETRWLCFGGDYAQAPKEVSGRTILARLPAEDLRALSEHLEAFKPTHVITSDILSPEAKALLAGLTPPPKQLVMAILPDAVFGVSPESDLAAHVALVSSDPKRRDYFGRCAWFLDWLGLKKPGLAPAYLLAGARPDYAAVMANASARSSPAHITIVSGGLCGNRRTLRKNPYFKDVDLGGIRTHYGCSFCSSASMPSLTPPGEGLEEIVESQFRGIMETAGAAGRNKGIYEFFDFSAFLKFDEVFEIVLRLKTPPSVFLFNPRLDDVLRVRRKIEATLPALARAGHEVRFLSMGIENFSERENARFNKEISLGQVDEFLGLARRWEDLYPGVFKPFKAGHDKVELGFILFTPWTTLADLKINLTRARERHFAETGYWLYSTLHIRKVEPIYRLAFDEGDVLVEDWPDGQAYGLVKNEGEAGSLIPWRFKDSRVSAFFALLVRVCATEREGAACAFFKGDREFALAARLYARARTSGEVTPLSFAFELLSAIEAAPPGAAREALLRKALAKGSEAPAPSAAARAVARVLALLKKTPLQAAAKMRLRSVEDLAGPGPERLRLTFTAQGRKITVDLLDGDSQEPCFLRSRLYRAVYHAGAPVTSPEQLRFLTLMLRLLDEAAPGHRAARPRATPAGPRGARRTPRGSSGPRSR